MLNSLYPDDSGVFMTTNLLAFMKSIRLSASWRFCAILSEFDTSGNALPWLQKPLSAGLRQDRSPPRRYTSQSLRIHTIQWPNPRPKSPRRSLTPSRMSYSSPSLARLHNSSDVEGCQNFDCFDVMSIVHLDVLLGAGGKLLYWVLRLVTVVTV